VADGAAAKAGARPSTLTIGMKSWPRMDRLYCSRSVCTYSMTRYSRDRSHSTSRRLQQSRAGQLGGYAGMGAHVFTAVVSSWVKSEAKVRYHRLAHEALTA